MVKKYVFRLPSAPPAGEEDDGEKQAQTREVHGEKNTSHAELLKINERLHDELMLQKNNITSYHRKRKWEKYKKLSNDYELIYSTNNHFPSISSYQPLSRSYFKLWEILTDMGDAMGSIMDASKSHRVAFLADAPGGFVQAFVDFRRKVVGRVGHVGHAANDDKGFAISLRPRNNYTPQWKLSQDFCRENNIEIVYGADGSGDLCNPSVVESFVERVGRGSCQLVTADGGFDFSSDFNGQEEMSVALIVSEVIAAMQLQAPGGAFVLKIYDVRTPKTIRVLQLLARAYAAVHVFKPLSSRPANSEKYVVATGFLNLPHCTAADVSTALEKGDGKGGVRFLHDIVQYNTYYIASQIACICKTIRYIHTEKTQRDVCKTQLYKAIKWCHKYKIPINLKALQSYQAMTATAPAAQAGQAR